MADLEREVDRTIWCREFIELMRNRLLMGFLRYGPKKKDSPKYDYAGSIATKIQKYIETGNRELLVDIGNYSMLEFKFGEHPNSHFESTDDVDHAKRK